jgi:hypothetical protein
MGLRVRACALAAACAAAAIALPAHAASGATAKAAKVTLGPNLLPNPSFEASQAEPAPVPAYTTSQPLLPVGWAFEGVAGLFDHGQHGAHTGKRAVTISDPLSGPTSVCQQKQCVANPADGPRDSARTYYSETPMWRTLQAVPVAAGKTYQVSTWVSWALVTIGVGAVTEVRWVDANGLPVGMSAGPTLVANARTSPALAWTKIAATVKAPAGARGAIVLLGHGDDTWISSITYDDAYFGTYATK